MTGGGPFEEYVYGDVPAPRITRDPEPWASWVIAGLVAFGVFFFLARYCR